MPRRQAEPVVDRVAEAAAAAATAAAATAAEAVAPEPFFVNPKQFHRIMKRREQRVKHGWTPNSARQRYASRMRHAERRVRGTNGRFVPKEIAEQAKALLVCGAAVLDTGAPVGAADVAQQLRQSEAVAVAMLSRIGGGGGGGMRAPSIEQSVQSSARGGALVGSVTSLPAPDFS